MDQHILIMYMLRFHCTYMDIMDIWTQNLRSCSSVFGCWSEVLGATPSEEPEVGAEDSPLLAIMLLIPSKVPASISTGASAWQDEAYKSLIWWFLVSTWLLFITRSSTEKSLRCRFLGFRHFMLLLIGPRLPDRHPVLNSIIVLVLPGKHGLYMLIDLIWELEE